MTHDDPTELGPESPDEPLTGDALGAQELLRAMPRVVPDPAYRAWMASEFVSGAIADEGARGEQRAEAARVAAESAEAARPIAARRPGSRWVRLVLATAALLLVGGFAWALNPGPRWQAAKGQVARGNVLVDDDAIPADDVASLNDALLAGSTIEWNGTGDLELVSQGQVALAITPGTRMTLPAPPPRWFARHSAGRVEHGEIRLTSGAGFHGARMVIATPEATVTMTGTTLAVIQEPAGTCVCVLEGKVHVMAGAHDMGMVPGGQRQVVFADGSPPVRAEIRPDERVKLGEMRAAMGPVLGLARPNRAR